jgi:hypothetical protein
MVEERAAGGVQRPAFFWTKAGVVAMHSARGLAAPRPVVDPRPGRSLRDKTDFELIKLWGTEGWEWHLWAPRTKRRRGHAALPDAYVEGEPKMWFSTAVVPPRSYLLALLQSPEPSVRRWSGWLGGAVGGRSSRRSASRRRDVTLFGFSFGSASILPSGFVSAEWFWP